MPDYIEFINWPTEDNVWIEISKIKSKCRQLHNVLNKLDKILDKKIDARLRTSKR